MLLAGERDKRKETAVGNRIAYRAQIIRLPEGVSGVRATSSPNWRADDPMAVTVWIEGGRDKMGNRAAECRTESSTIGGA